MMQPTALRGYHRLGRSQLHHGGGCSPSQACARTHPQQAVGPHPDECGTRSAAALATLPGIAPWPASLMCCYCA